MERDLVLLHGWAMSGRVWEAVTPALSAACRVHNLGLPGYGRIDDRRPTRDGTVDGQTVLDRWSDACLAAAPAGAIWLGWSLGALVVMNAALRSPGRLEAAVLVSATPKFTGEEDWRAGVAPGVMRGFLDALRTNDRRALKRFVMLQAGGSDDIRLARRTLMHSLAGAEVDRTTLEAGLDVLEQVDLRARLGDIDLPVLVVHGAGDRVVPAAAGAWLASRVPSGELVSLDAGHAPFATRPREFSEAVLEWI